ncbi:MAG: DUF4244 domain-containing protein [Bifidobacteriaceae bacterium]|jgi:hypothetical protein|nr:DUF4244 domain-containing protein [Bifidobacteriaceae bacterium]
MNKDKLYNYLHPCFSKNAWQRFWIRFQQWLLNPVISKPSHGLATAEYAIVAIAATAFAGVLIVILKSDAVRGWLEDIIHQALTGFSS